MLGLAAGVIGRFVDGLPIFRPVNNAYARNLVLKQLGAAVMICMSVRENDVFDLILVQTEHFQAPYNFIIRGIVEQSLDDNNALVAHDRPCAMNLGAEEIQVIGDFGRFGIPRVSGRRTARCSAPASSNWRSHSL